MRYMEVSSFFILFLDENICPLFVGVCCMSVYERSTVKCLFLKLKLKDVLKALPPGSCEKVLLKGVSYSRGQPLGPDCSSVF